METFVEPGRDASPRRPSDGLTFSIRALRKAAPRRLPGYMEECLRLGQLSENGLEITFTRRDFRDIQLNFSLSRGLALSVPCCCG